MRNEPEATPSEQRAFFEHNGFLPYGRIYTDEQVEARRDALARLQAHDALSVEPGEPADGSVAVFIDLAKTKGKTKPSVTGAFRVDETRRSHCMNRRLAQAAGELLDVAATRFQGDHIIVKEPERSGPRLWRQDATNMPFDRSNQIACWLALDHVTPDSGGMRYVGGSHMLSVRGRIILETGQQLDAEMKQIPQDPEADGFTVAAPTLEPGECVFHDALTSRATHTNTTNRLRRAVMTRYFEDGAVFTPAQSPPPPIAFLTGLTPGEPITRENEFPVLWRRD